MTRDVPVEIIKHIASFVPPSSAFVHLLCLSRDVYDLVLPVLWTHLEIGPVQLHALLTAFHSDALRASPNPHLSPAAPTPNDMLRTPWNQNTVTRWTAAPSPSAVVLHRSRQPLRRPWAITKSITLWAPASLETANMILPFLDQLTPPLLFPSLETLRIPYSLLEALSQNSFAHSYDLKKKHQKLHQAFTRIFRPSHLVVLGVEHFPGVPIVRKLGLEAGPMLWSWIAHLGQEWVCVRRATWSGVGFHQICLVGGITNTVRMAPGEDKAQGGNSGTQNWHIRMDSILGMVWTWEMESRRLGETVVRWEGPYPPRQEVEALERRIVEGHPLLAAPELRQALLQEVNGESRLRCFEYVYPSESTP